MRHLTVLDTGTGHNFVRMNALTEAAQRAIRPGRLPDIRDANKGKVRTVGTVTLRCQLGSYETRVNFVVCERLSVPVILGCDFCDRYVEAIMPRQKMVELDDGSTVPIIRVPSTRARDAVPLPAPLRYPTAADPPAPKVHASRSYKLQPRSQTWIEVVSKHHGVGVVEPLPLLYERQSIALANGIVQTMPGQKFRILIANFSDHVRAVQRNQVVGHVLPDPQALAPSKMHTGAMLGIMENTSPISSDAEDTDAEKPDNVSVSSQPVRHEHKKEVTSAAELDLDHVPEKYRDELRSMLDEFHTMYDGRLGEINVTEHSIDLQPGTRPIHANPYREGPKTREIVKDEVERQLRAGVIEPAQSAWASPVVIVPKPDGTPRFCVDYRRLNAVTVRDSYPLPRMDDCIDSLGEAVVFTTLDANCGYWQLPIREADQELTTFTCHRGTFKYVRMPFGLSNAPATFQRVLDIVLSRYRWQTCLVYLDDVIIFSKNRDEHIQHVREVLTSLRDAGVSLKLRKCEFFKSSVRYLGHVIRPGRLEVDLARVAALKEAKEPRTQTELRSFLGLCNVYRRFIRNYTKMAKPLYDMLKKGQPSKFAQLTEEASEAFKQLIDVVVNPPVLGLPRADLPYSIDTDASDYQLGVALYQHLPDGSRQTLGYWSRTLQGAEQNYSTPEKECLAVVWACGVLRPYLQGGHFVVHTDQASLRWLLTTTEGTGRLMRWRLRLSEFDFTVKYKKGTSNSVADCLSRLGSRGSTTDEVDDEIPCFALEALDLADHSHDDEETPSKHDVWEDHDLILVASGESDGPRPSAITVDELIREQAEDDFCCSMREQLDAGKLVPFEEDRGGVLVRTVEGHPQIVVPQTLVPRVLTLAHRPKSAGHPGETKMYKTLRRHFYWPTLSVDAVTTVKNCVSCARNRVRLRRKSTALQLFPATGPLEFVAIDILGPFIRTKNGNRYLLVIGDRFSKLTRTVPLRNITEAAVARAFTTHWAFCYGPPSILLSDNGKQFASRLFVHVCKIMGTNNAFTSTYHPQANGQVERFNRTILAALRHYVLDNPRDWDEFTPALTYAYNTQIHRITGFSPFELTLSRPPPHLAIQSRPDMSALENRASSFERWRLRLKTLFATAARSSVAARARYKRDFDRRLRRNAETLTSGMYVFVRRDYAPKTDGSVPRKHKLSPVADGPFRVISVDEKTVVIDDAQGNEERLSLDRVVKAPVTDDVTTAAIADPRTPVEVQARAAGPPPAEIVQPAPDAIVEPGAGESIGDSPAERYARPTTLSPRSVLQQIEYDLGLVPQLSRDAVTPVQEPDSDESAEPAVDDEVDISTVSPPSPTPRQPVPLPQPTNPPTPPRPRRLNVDELAQFLSIDAAALARALVPSEQEQVEATASHIAARSRLGSNPEESPSATQPRADSQAPRAVSADPTSAHAETAQPVGQRPNPAETQTSQRRHLRRKRTTSMRPASASSRRAAPAPKRQKRLYVVDRLVDHDDTPSGPVYRVHWQDCLDSEDTWEPLSHLRRSHVVRYHRQRRLPLPAGMHTCLQG